MTKKVIKAILVVLILTVFAFILISPNIYAGEDGFLTELFRTTASFFEEGRRADTTGAAQEMTQEIQPLINILYWIGIAVVMGASMMLGIQYFKASGDPKEKAEIQGKLIGFLLSSVVLIAAYPIWKFLIGFLSSLIVS